MLVLQPDQYKHLRTNLEAYYDAQRKSAGIEINERFFVKDLGTKVSSLDYALSVHKDSSFMPLLTSGSRSFLVLLAALMGNLFTYNYCTSYPRQK